MSNKDKDGKSVVHALRGGIVPNQPNAEVISHLEELLQEAKDGKYNAVAYVAISNGPTQDLKPGWTGAMTVADMFRMIGVLKYIEGDIMEAAVDTIQSGDY